MRRLLVAIGIAAVLIGLFWPWLAKLGLGRLPGDIVIERGSFTFYLPLTTGLLASLLLTLFLWLIGR
jgi:hypothetical protein